METMQKPKWKPVLPSVFEGGLPHPSVYAWVWAMAEKPILKLIDRKNPKLVAGCTSYQLNPAYWPPVIKVKKSPVEPKMPCGLLILQLPLEYEICLDPSTKGPTFLRQNQKPPYLGGF